MSKGRWTSRKIGLVVRAVQDLGLTVVGVEVTETGGVKVNTRPASESIPEPCPSKQREWIIPDDPLAEIRP
jgi:hypothetical protein